MNWDQIENNWADITRRMRPDAPKLPRLDSPARPLAIEAAISLDEPDSASADSRAPETRERM